ncbi:histidine kinase [Phocaeicola coprocola DSM 17136]|uniref:Histidine kinase n=1 Tax=Phocaeicola coprocola DSM 17136 TaxID=470145 RepID=B3JKI9_9BACT|nr:histidine kinase [Phocaeicola coprocola]EDV00499.1 histidine kinase [Phocaeicola coprocola DSM 17136]MCC3347700.1 histidine kinase [Phocaeicola coprocola DSM 17136]
MPFMFAGKKRFWIAVSLILLTAVGTYLITRYQMKVPLHHMRRTRLLQHIQKIKLQQQAVWFLYVVVIAFSAAVGLLTQLYHQIMERQAVEFEKKKAELALYKAQINPHFLFNNLNTLYAMVVTESPKTEDAFIQFINLMKYMYANNTKDKIPLHIEVEYIRQYIELQKYRIAENFDVHFSYVHDETEQMNIAPMILITFVEYVFKHGVSSHKKGEAYITIRVEKGELLLATNNPLLNHPDSKTSKGIGIENCKKRLDLLYPNRYSLFTGEREGKYAVTLSINLRQ